MFMAEIIPNPYGIAALWAQGDVVIKTVAIALLLMSMVSWSVIGLHTWRAARLRRAALAATGFWHTHSFAEGMALLDQHGLENPFRHLAAQAQAAVDHHTSNQQDLHGHISLVEWLTESLRGAIDDSAEQISSGLAILASVGSTAPFVGLFGTVWGIYHALVGISTSGQVGIDKVAGPVGEALIMTAFGLFVAIPAVLGYNALTRNNKGLINKLNRFARQLHAYFLTGAPVAKGDGKVMPFKRAHRGQ
jgi:biopolymer transport protein ExbB